MSNSFDEIEDDFNELREFILNDLEWKPVAPSIYDAFRNGLAHSFATKVLMQINSEPIEIGISWKEKSHFMFDHVNSVIYINIVNLADALRQAFYKYEKELRDNSELCTQYKTKRRKKRTVNVQNYQEKEEWIKLIKR